MSVCMRVFLCLTLIAAACGGTCAANKIVLDPNGNGAITAAIYAETDPHLIQKVTYEARFKPVYQIIDDLREMTSVKLIAGKNDSEWQVRNRKMNIFVKDVPLTELMDSIARTMKFRWSRYDNTNPLVYRLKINNRAASLAETQRANAERIYEEKWRKVRLDWIDGITKYGDYSMEQIATLRKSDPVLQRYGRHGSVKAMKMVFDQFPETKDLFANGQSFRVSVNKLSPDAKSQIYSAGNEFWTYLQYHGKAEPKGFAENELKPTDTFDITFHRSDKDSFTPGMRWGLVGKMTCGWVDIRKGAFVCNLIDLLDRDLDWNRYICECRNVIIDKKGQLDEAYPDAEARTAKIANDLKKEDDLLYPNEPLIEHKPFSGMEKTVKVKLDPPKPDDNPALAVNETVAAVEKAMFDATGIGVVSDSWVNIEGKFLSQESTLEEVLNKFSEAFNYNWDKQGSILEFRHRKWAKMRLNQIPDEWVAAWSANTEKNGRTSLDDMAAICNLTYDQAEECIKADKVLGNEDHYRWMLESLDDNYLWLKLYSTLNDQMKKLLMGPVGVNGQMLTTDQWKMAQKMFDRIGSTRGDALFRLKDASEGKYGIFQFREFDMDSENNSEDRAWDLWLPNYTPPVKTPESKK